MAERPDTDWLALADKIDGPERITYNDLRAAADGLRQLAALTTAIGDPDELTFIAGRCLDEAMACQQIGGFSETVGVLSRAAVALQCVATAGGCDPEEGSE